jgi:hypothetical protein
LGSGHLPSDFHRLVGKSGVSHLASIVLASDTFGHSLAFFEKFRLVRLAADGGMRKADAIIRQPI